MSAPWGVEYEETWLAKFGRGGTHEHRGPWARRRVEPAPFIGPMPFECPRCQNFNHWAAVDAMFTRFICRECWHAWGTEKETKP